MFFVVLIKKPKYYQPFFFSNILLQYLSYLGIVIKGEEMINYHHLSQNSGHD